MEYFTEGENENIMEPLSLFSWKRLCGVLIAGIVCVGFLWYGFGAPKNFPENGGTFTVVPGQSLKSISTELKTENYIRSRFIFSTLVTIFGGEHHVSPGDYYFAHTTGVLGIARQIGFGDHNLEPIKITIPEGDTASEMGVILSQKLSAFSATDFAQEAKPYEGYLFPETYFLYPKTSSGSVIGDMRAMFEKQTAPLFAAYHLTDARKAAAVIMASLIEREAHGDDDRATIAGILYKRLSLGMPLQVDATVAYANGKEESLLQKSDFSTDSPYNTYTYKGLPPGPISNPGIEALTAALNPTVTPYLYYLHDKHGTIHYAKTYSEHLANIKRYL